MIEGSARFGLVFSDPALYGAFLSISKPAAGDKPNILSALAGLYAEILYRKVSTTIGVYKGPRCAAGSCA